MRESRLLLVAVFGLEAVLLVVAIAVAMLARAGALAWRPGRGEVAGETVSHFAATRAGGSLAVVEQNHRLRVEGRVTMRPRTQCHALGQALGPISTKSRS